MKRCAYLTMQDTTGWSIDADLGFPPLQALGWRVEAIAWRSEEPDWNGFDAVYIGVPWDYPQEPQRFMAVLEAIDSSSAILVNDLALVRWSMAKTYLRDLESRGAAIVPSLWYDDMDLDLIDAAFRIHGSDRLIVKPVVSTNATDTYLLTRARAHELGTELERVFRQRPFVVQPFISNIQRDGEFSLFYFNREFSHAIRKLPKQGDFRVQEEHGADIVAVTADESLLAAGQRVIDMVAPAPAYARADFVRGENGQFLLMELELIEPSMYLRMDAKAPQRFADAFDQYVAKRCGDSPR